MKSILIVLCAALTLCAHQQLAITFTNKTGLPMIIHGSENTGPFGWAGYYRTVEYQAQVAPHEAVSVLYGVMPERIALVHPEGIVTVDIPYYMRSRIGQDPGQNLIVRFINNRVVIRPAHVDALEVIMERPPVAQDALNYLQYLPRELQQLLFNFLRIDLSGSVELGLPHSAL
jgi:hypothetical protein